MKESENRNSKEEEGLPPGARLREAETLNSDCFLSTTGKQMHGRKLMKTISDQFLHKIESNLKKLELSKNKTCFPDCGHSPCYENNRFRNTFIEIIEIGQGAFGHVYKAKNRLESKFYAIKQIDIGVAVGEDPRQLSFFGEVAAMSNLKHRNIVSYITSWLEQQSQSTSTLQNESMP